MLKIVGREFEGARNFVKSQRMKILVLGGGGREHALVWKIKQSPLVTQLVCSPGNAGIAQICECLSGDPLDVALQIDADLVVVGPDGLLADGVADKLRAADIPVVGPSQSAARLESSKIFTKNLLQKYGVPSAKFAAFESADEAKNYLQSQPDGPIVVKADGLAVGKGVVVAASREEAIAGVDEVTQIAGATTLGDAGRIVIEEMMSGPEISFFALTDGQTLLPLIEARDYKRAFDGDAGPNTGGMGCFSPVPDWTPQLREQVIETILKPTLAGLQAEKIEYRGVLYCGLMLTDEGPKVVEYNARFGDPECQLIMARLKDDIVPILMACAGMDVGMRDRKMSDFKLKWRDEAAVLVVMAAANYPAAPRKGDRILGLNRGSTDDTMIFHAGTKLDDGEFVTNGGRVLGVTALAPDRATARANAYEMVENITFDGAHYRSDIALDCGD